MFDAFNALDPLLQGFWLVALPSSLIFLIQAVMTFAGAAAPQGVELIDDLDGGDAPFHLFSLRNLLNFLLGFSWTGIAFYDVMESKTLLLLLSLGVGSSFVYGFFVIIRQIQKLAEDNSFRIESTLNKTAEVYLTVPENQSGKGKIMVSVGGVFHELEAMTEDLERLPTGSSVKIVRVEQGNIVFVEPLSK
jgi:hypothetical protein